MGQSTIVNQNLAMIGEVQLSRLGIHTMAELKLAAIHSNKKGAEWVKYLDRISNDRTPEGKERISAALERIDKQVKADKTIMPLMEPSRLKELTRKIIALESVLK